MRSRPAGSPHTPGALRALYLSAGTWIATLAPFAAVILHSHGLDTVTIGLLSGLAALTAMIVVPAWGHLADVLVGRVVAFRIGLLIATFAALALWLPLPTAALAVIVASFVVFPAIFLGLSDALAVDALPAPERQYGAVRALASFSFAVGVIVAGFIYNQAGYAAAPLVALVLAMVLFVVVGRVPDRTRDPLVRSTAASHGGPAAAGRFGSISRALSVQPRLWVVLGVFILGYTGLMGAVIFVGIRIVDLGGQPSDVALSFGVAAFAEVPGLVLAGWIGRRIGIRWLVVLALVVYGVCIESWGLLPTPIGIIATRLVTGVCFGALAAAQVLIVARLLPIALQATGQTLMQAATFAIGNAAGGLIGGVLYDAIGPGAFFGVAGVLAILGGLGAWVVLHGSVGAPAQFQEVTRATSH